MPCLKPCEPYANNTTNSSVPHGKQAVTQIEWENGRIALHIYVVSSTIRWVNEKWMQNQNFKTLIKIQNWHSLHKFCSVCIFNCLFVNLKLWHINVCLPCLPASIVCVCMYVLISLSRYIHIYKFNWNKYDLFDCECYPWVKIASLKFQYLKTNRMRVMLWKGFYFLLLTLIPCGIVSFLHVCMNASFNDVLVVSLSRFFCI